VEFGFNQASKLLIFAASSPSSAAAFHRSSAVRLWRRLRRAVVSQRRFVFTRIVTTKAPDAVVGLVTCTLALVVLAAECTPRDHLAASARPSPRESSSRHLRAAWVNFTVPLPSSRLAWNFSWKQRRTSSKSHSSAESSGPESPSNDSSSRCQREYIAATVLEYWLCHCCEANVEDYSSPVQFSRVVAVEMVRWRRLRKVVTLVLAFIVSLPDDGLTSSSPRRLHHAPQPLAIWIDHQQIEQLVGMSVANISHEWRYFASAETQNKAEIRPFSAPSSSSNRELNLTLPGLLTSDEDRSVSKTIFRRCKNDNKLQWLRAFCSSQISSGLAICSSGPRQLQIRVGLIFT